jgi:P2 family phage contractile tail tube protein
MSTTVNWRSLIEDNIKLIASKIRLWVFRGSVEKYDLETGDITSQAVNCVMRVVPKTNSLGSFAPAKQTGTNGVYEVLYIKISVDNKEVLEYDRFAFIFKVDGVDYLKKIREDIGLS